MAGEIAGKGTPLCRVQDIPEEGSRGFTIGEGEWPLRGLVVKSGPVVDAYVNRCPHAGHQLNLVPDKFLTPDNRLILCRSHGAYFEKASGRCIFGPCVGESLPRVKVVVDGEYVKLAEDVDIDQLATRHW